MTEVSLVWNKLQTGVIDRRPIVLMGECWKPVISALRDNLVVNEADIRFLSFAEDAKGAAEIIMRETEGVAV